MKDALQLMVLLHLLFVVVPIFGNDGGYSLQYHGVLSGGLDIEVRLHARKFFACSLFSNRFFLFFSLPNRIANQGACGCHSQRAKSSVTPSRPAS